MISSIIRRGLKCRSFSSSQSRRASQPDAWRYRPSLVALESRCLLSTVTNLDNAGAGSLRGAIASTPAGETVDFEKGLSGTIPLSTGELQIAKHLTIAGPGADLITVSGNHTSRVFDIGANYTVEISGLTIADGYDGIVGGGVVNHGRLTITDSTISGNAASAVGAEGGGIGNDGALTILHCIVSNNLGGGGAVGGAGGISNANGTVTILRSIISGNSSGGFRSSYGGGIGNYYRGTMTIIDSTISDNFVTANGFGGGIWNDGQLTVTNSTMSGNSVLDLGGAIASSGTATLTNCTFSGNTAGRGGAIANEGTMTIADSTVNGNSAITGEGGGIWDLNAVYSVTQLRNTIVAGNSGQSAPDFSMNLVSLGHNLIGDGAGGNGYDESDLVGTSNSPIDPLLGPLEDNGGPTYTMALQCGGPAIDAGDNTDAPDWDQRGDGFPRIVNGIIDIGAYEVQKGECDGSKPHGSQNSSKGFVGAALVRNESAQAGFKNFQLSADLQKNTSQLESESVGATQIRQGFQIPHGVPKALVDDSLFIDLHWVFRKLEMDGVIS